MSIYYQHKTLEEARNFYPVYNSNFYRKWLLGKLVIKHSDLPLQIQKEFNASSHNKFILDVYFIYTCLIKYGNYNATYDEFIEEVKADDGLLLERNNSTLEYITFRFDEFKVLEVVNNKEPILIEL